MRKEPVVIYLQRAKQGMEAHAYKPSTQEAEAGGFHEFQISQKYKIFFIPQDKLSL